MSEHAFLTHDERMRVSAPFEQAWTLPPRAYTDPAAWSVEVDQIFRRDWVAVARVEQLPEPGDHLPIELAGQPIVLIRDEYGVLRALSNVCLHRSMPLVDEAGNGHFLTCPYHLWSYDREGQLRTAPLMEEAEGFDRHDCRLPTFPVEVWEGFVFVSLDPGAEALAPQLEPLRELLAPWRFGESVVVASADFDSSWNWKLLVENFMEAYHHIGPHRATLQLGHPAADSFVVDNEGGLWSALQMPGDDGELIAASVYPTLLLAGSSMGPIWYQLDVDGHDHFHLRTHLLGDPEHVDDPEFQAALTGLVDMLTYVHIEDIAVNEGPWKGLHAPTATQGRLAPLEKAIWQLNQLWLDRVCPT